MPMSETAVKRRRPLKARYRRILRFASLALAQTWWFELFLPQLGLSKLAARGRIKRLKKLARKFHDLAADLGGLMVKVGQFLSARLDVLPQSVTVELEGLQDEVAPEPFEKILRLIADELGMNPSTAFASVDPEPIAAASLGQAYRAKLSVGLAEDMGMTDVVIKVLRPGIEDIVAVDLAALRKIGGWLSRVKLVSKRTDAPALVEEFAQTTLEEIDYLHEAKNLERFAENFNNDDRVATPEIVWERTSRRVLTLSDVSAIKISDIDALLAAGINPNSVAAELAKVTFEQFFLHGFFHADPHPGNIFVRKTEDAFALVFIDFGMMGQIDDNLRSNLQRFLFAVAARDARGWIEACERLGVLLPTADKVILEKAVSELFERFGGVAVGDLVATDPEVLKEFAIRFSEIVRTLPFQLPNDFLFLIRALSLISGVASTLNQEFNIWDALDPFARTLLNGGGSSTFAAIRKELVSFATTLAGLPQRFESLLSRAERGELVIRNPELERRVRILDSSVRRAGSGVVFAGLLVAGLIVRNDDATLGGWLVAASVPLALYALGVFRIIK